MGERIRGRVWQSQRPDRRRRLRGSRYDWSGATWNYEVTIDGAVIMADNSGYWQDIYDTCRRNVAALRRVKSALDVEALPKRWAER